MMSVAPMAAVVAAGALALVGCSSSSGGSGSSSSGAAAGGGSSSAGSSSSGGSAGCFSGTLSAEGSTAQANAMTTWIKDFQKQCSGATVNYNPTGSGDGVQAFISNQVAFAGSDAALGTTAGATQQAQKRCGSTPLDLPMVGGPIALGYKLSGVSKLVLDGPTVAKIFLGHIKTWNDPAIAALNKGAKLPATKITPFYRSDASGTTFNFENWLAATAKSVFKTAPDKDSSTANFAGQGKTGSQGVAQAAASTNGGIGYFEYSYAVQSGLNTVDIDNGGGAVPVSPNSASAMLASSRVTGSGSDLTMNLDYATKAKGAYPITLVTYEIVCSKYKSGSDAQKVKNFLSYLVGSGQSALKQQGYAPLPTSLQSRVKAAVATIS
jgi:phosphate transport system substrate-binding protein